MITDSQAWFREVSHRRYTVSGTVTPWLRIDPPADCFQSSFTTMNAAIGRRERAGFSPSSYGRVVLYLPCSAGGITGLGSLPGSQIWLYGTLDQQTVMHEQGHNLGLNHASSRECEARGWPSVTLSSNCSVSEYGDTVDVMGNRRGGHYSGQYKSQLGWLQRGTTVSSTRTVTLAPYETTGPGYKAIRLTARGATYWLEYRTRTGFDAGLSPGTAGVQIRGQVGARTNLLDAGPGTISGLFREDMDDTHLPAGSSWTTPEGVRITVTGQTATGATVAFRFGAGAARVPGVPTRPRATAGLKAARITWTRPADNGSIIRRYVVRRVDNGAERVLTTTGGLLTSYRWDGLRPGTSYRFTVRAVSQVRDIGAIGGDRRGEALVGPADGADHQPDGRGDGVGHRPRALLDHPGQRHQPADRRRRVLRRRQLRGLRLHRAVRPLRLGHPVRDGWHPHPPRVRPRRPVG